MTFSSEDGTTKGSILIGGPEDLTERCRSHVCATRVQEDNHLPSWGHTPAFTIPVIHAGTAIDGSNRVFDSHTDALMRPSSCTTRVQLGPDLNMTCLQSLQELNQCPPLAI